MVNISVHGSYWFEGQYFKVIYLVQDTLPETNTAPETLGMEDEFLFGKAMSPGAMLVFGSVVP